MWRRSTSLTSFNVREPEAKLRGLAYASSDSRLKISKSAYEITASPRITVCPWNGMVAGMPPIAFAKCVMLVPICPFPRVTTLDNLPPS